MHAAEPPVVDPRTSEDLAARLRDRARETTPEWQPPPEGDVGTALHQVASRFAAQVIDRVNRTPSYAMRGFLASAGLRPLPSHPARVTVAFDLRPGESRAVVPAGTQVEAPASGSRPAVVFETVRDLTVLPARVAVAEVIDAVWDRVTDLVGADTELGVPALAGLDPARHDLLVTSGVLAAVEDTTTVALSLHLESASPRSETVALAQSLRLAAVRSGQEQLPAGASSRVSGRGTSVTLTVSAQPGPVDALTLMLTGALLDHPCAERDLVRGAELTVDTAPRPPRAVTVDGAPTDPASSFRPLGEVPGPGSELAIADPLLAHAGAQITVSVKLDPGTPRSANLVWEWHDGTAWRTLTGVADTTGALAADGTITFTSPGCGEAEVAGIRGHWVRVRLLSGGFGQPARYVPKEPANLGAGMQVQQGTGDLDAPRVLTLTLAAHLHDDAPLSVRRSHRHTDIAVGQPLAAGLGTLPGPDATPGQAVLVGFDGDLGNQQVSLHVSTAEPPPSPRGTSQPRTVGAGLGWEYLGVTGWRPLTVTDGTDAFRRSGVVSFLAPDDLTPTALAGHPSLRWVRARADAETTPSGGPRISALTVNAVEAVAGESVGWEALGAADGLGNGRLRLSRTPVLPGQELYARELEPPQGEEVRALLATQGPSAVTPRTDPATGRTEVWVRWQEVASFTTSGPRDRHYTLDRAGGVVRFGDGDRGLAAPRGTPFAARYRFGPGAAGNVPAGAVTRLRTAVPAVSTVRSVVAADGGSDAESMEMYERRAPAAIRHRGRAITAADVLWHTRELAGTRVARCLVPAGIRRGEMAVVVVPQSEGPAPAPTATLLALLEEELDRRLAAGLTLHGGVDVLPPSYRQVGVVADLEPEHPEQAEAVKARALTALDTFLHALTGGPEGTGWPLGRAVYESEIAERLGDVAGIRTIRSIRLVPSALSLRLRFRSPVLVPLGLTVGSPVALDGTTTVWTLDEPVPAGTAVEGVTVRGVTEGDRLHVLLDAEAAGSVEAGATSVVVPLELHHTPEAPVTFPAGSSLVDENGRILGLTRRTVVTAEQRLDVTVSPLAQPVHHGQRLTLVHAQGLSAARVAGTDDSGAHHISLRADDSSAIRAGATLGVVGHPLRVPVSAVTASPADGPVVSTRLWQPGDRVDLLGGEPAGFAEIATVLEVGDVVHLDPGSLVRSGTHVIRMVQG